MTTLRLSSKWQGWLQATRPKTLTAAIVPFMAGSALAYSRGYPFDLLLLISALAAAVAIQIGTNFINDSFDFVRGADGDERLGQKRAIQMGVASSQQMFNAGLASFGAALIMAIPLLMEGGGVLSLLLVLSIVCGYLYTGGVYPLAYHGLGDLFVIVFFGWVSTLAAYWLQAGSLDVLPLLLGTQIGLLATALIAINNLRDIAGDAIVHKRTLPVRFGVFFGRLEISAVLLLPFILNLLWYFAGYTFTAALPWLIFPLALPLVAEIWQTEPSPIYNKFLAQAAFLHLSFGGLFSIGVFLDK